MKYRKKPIVIEAWQLTVTPTPMPEWLIAAVKTGAFQAHSTHPFVISTREGRMGINFGDWVIQGIKGELYPCGDDIFQATYEAV